MSKLKKTLKLYYQHDMNDPLNFIIEMCGALKEFGVNAYVLDEENEEGCEVVIIEQNN